MELKIDPEFKDLLPPLKPEEYEELEKSLLEDGCRDAIITWEGIIVDGHNRYEICQREEIPFKTIGKCFEDREAVKDWIDTNQYGRRNLTQDQMSLIRGRRYERLKKSKSEAGAIGGSSKDQNDTCLPSTADRLAKEYHVSAPTIKRDGQFAQAVENLKPVIPDIEKMVMSGDIPSKQAVIEAAKEPEKAQEKLKPKSVLKEIKDKADQINKKARGVKIPQEEELISLEFKEAWEGMVKQIKNAKALKWKTTSRKVASKYVGYLSDIINAGG